MFVSACNECDRGTFRCTGEKRQICESQCSEPGCTAEWKDDPCSGGVCIDVAGEDAFCAVRSTPDPGCKGEQAYCDGQTAVSCRAGFRVAARECAGKTPACIVPDYGGDPVPINARAVFCAPSADKDPRCPDTRGLVSVCDGGDRLSCDTGYLISADTCPRGCVASTPQIAICES